MFSITKFKSRYKENIAAASDLLTEVDARCNAPRAVDPRTYMARLTDSAAAGAHAAVNRGLAEP